MSTPRKHIVSRTAVMAGENIDTDQIIPARFLTTTSRSGLGKHLFHSWRFDTEGNTRDFVLDRPEAQGCRILVAGRNFGCGSSREHAPWALLDHGFEAVISSEIADIFSSNALKNGLVPIVVDAATHTWLLDNPGAQIEIDIEAALLRLPDREPIAFAIDSFSQHCLLHGVDELGFLLQQADAIAAFEAERHL